MNTCPPRLFPRNWILALTSALALFAGFDARPAHAQEKPPTAWVPAHPENYQWMSGVPMRDIQHVVIHTVEGTAGGAIAWFQNPNAGVSAHYVVNFNGAITEMVEDKNVAWHAGNSWYNAHSIGIEHAGYAGQNLWTEELYASSAALTRWICLTYGVPMTHGAILGHNEIPGTNHWDPGPYFDWDHYIALVNGPLAAPAVELFDAAPLAFPNAPNSVDCNSPLFTHEGQLHLFTSVYMPSRSVGGSLDSLEGPQPVEWLASADSPPGGFWIEAVWFDESSGVLYGWYHLEPGDLDLGGLTAPIIGAAISHDLGATWEDQGPVLRSAHPIDPTYENGWFVGGNGDFHVILDAAGEYFYFLYSEFGGSVDGQGVCIARSAFADRGQPGTAVKYHEGDWAQPGLYGVATPIFHNTRSWKGPGLDSWWGPSVHWNTHLQRYVVVMNHAIEQGWAQEGIYLAFSEDLLHWTAPQKIMNGGPWYPEVVGESDTRAGEWARLFLRGESYHWLHFTMEAGEPAYVSAPSTPAVLSPGEGSTLSPGAVTIDWTDSADVHAYEIAVFNESGVVVHQSWPTDSSATIDLPGGSYGAHVWAQNHAGWSGEAAVHFSVMAVTPAAPTDQSPAWPAEGHEVAGAAVTLTWSGAADAEAHEVWVEWWDGSSYPFYASWESGPEPHFTFWPSIPGTWYRWWVRSRNSAGWGPWSDHSPEGGTPGGGAEFYWHGP